MNIVVGGGIAGIVSALLLAKKFDNVCLIEKGDEVGGLFKSVSSELGISFDYGTHYLRATGIDDLDEILFGGIPEKNWHIFEDLKAGSYYAGALNSNSSFLDARRLPREIYEKGMVELLNITDESLKPKNLEEQLRFQFGDTFTKHLFEPIISGKYYGCELNELMVNAHFLVGVTRILALTEEATKELKRSPIYDSKLAYHSPQQTSQQLSQKLLQKRVPSRKNYYPVNGGVSVWVDFLKQKLQAANVEVITGCSVRKINQVGGSISSVELDSQRQIECDRLIWTVPPALFLKAAGISFPEPKPAVKKLYTSLFHFAFDKPFLTDVYYVHCHDPHFKTFRVTLYSNLQGAKNGVYHLTSEVISPSPDDMPRLADDVLSELLEMGIIAADSEVLLQKKDAVPAGFPLLSPEVLSVTKSQVTLACDQFDNLSFLGRASGPRFRMGAVVTDAHATIAKIK